LPDQVCWTGGDIAGVVTVWHDARLLPVRLPLAVQHGFVQESCAPSSHLAAFQVVRAGGKNSDSRPIGYCRGRRRLVAAPMRSGFEKRAGADMYVWKARLTGAFHETLGAFEVIPTVLATRP
jgi:hypothetical protein